MALWFVRVSEGILVIETLILYYVSWSFFFCTHGEVLMRMEYSIPHGEVEEKDW
jgi:hypothetical protein